jgi:hypothetical protein
MTTSRKAHCRLLVFSSNAEDDDESGSWLVIVLSCFALVVEDNDELRGLSSSPNFFSSGAENDDNELGSKLIVVFGCFASVV